ncbi:MAG: hypothetical protein OFPII_19220 [Osedax symbiont Rs1]|nr:MAG: hypothetical protein OFPII_19220 [Osedax symbiont Rs1]
MTQEIEDKKKYLLHWMYDFIEDDDEPAYLKSDVEEFDQIISSFIKMVGESDDRADFCWISATVEALVKNLNQLNLKHEQQLIETDQCEDICQLIRLVIEKAGHECATDITAEWREW